MSKKLFNPHDCISALNELKREIQTGCFPFSKEAILSGLKKCGLPHSATFWSIFRNTLLQEVSKGKYMFSSKEPIYEGTLAGIKKKYQEKIRTYNQNQRKLVKPKSEIAKPLREDPEAMVQFAIDLLKEKGYKILAPIATLYKEI